MSRTYYKRGAWNCICEVCGFQYKSTDMVERYDGLFVCRADWEPKHDLDFMRVIVDVQTVPRPSPEPAPIYIQIQYYGTPPAPTPAPSPAPEPPPAPPPAAYIPSLDFSDLRNSMYL
jgi:hypothetical protein